MPRLIPEIAPDEQLNILDEIMALPGAGAVHYRIARKCLKDGLPLAAYSNPELAELTSRSERTVRAAKSWFHKHIGMLRQVSAAWLVEVPFSSDSSYEKESPPPSHAAEICRCEQLSGQTDQPDNFRGAVEKLKAMGWGKLLGCFQVRDPELFTCRFGARNVLYAIWCAEGHDARNPAGFVTYKLQQGLEAPEGWNYPIKDASSASVAAFMHASATPSSPPYEGMSRACPEYPGGISPREGVKGGLDPVQPQTGNQLILRFTENPGDCALNRLHHYGFHYDPAVRQWSAPETPATRDVWETEVELGAEGFKRPMSRPL